MVFIGSARKAAWVATGQTANPSPCKAPLRCSWTPAHRTPDRSWTSTFYGTRGGATRKRDSMKTKIIIKRLSAYSKEHEWVSNHRFIECPECKGNPAIGHKEGCEFVETIAAAAEYLEIMNGDTVWINFMASYLPFSVLFLARWLLLLHGGCRGERSLKPTVIEKPGWLYLHHDIWCVVMLYYSINYHVAGLQVANSGMLIVTTNE